MVAFARSDSVRSIQLIELFTCWMGPASTGRALDSETTSASASNADRKRMKNEGDFVDNIVRS